MLSRMPERHAPLTLSGKSGCFSGLQQVGWSICDAIAGALLEDLRMNQ